jgi:phage antirepressor YoqD-like protein
MSSFEKNQLAVNQVTMTSLELVDFINSQRKEGVAVLTHADFMKKVPKVLGEKDAGLFSDIYFDAYSREQRCYKFPKRESCLMAMSYSYDLQAKVFDRMTELEDALKQPVVALPNFTDPAEAAIAWAAEFKAKQAAITQVSQLEIKVSELAPKAAALDTIANATGQKTITNVAKVLGVQPEKFLRPWMLNHHWIYLGRDGQYHAHAARIKDGHLVEKSRAIPRTNGIADVKVTVYVTSLGETLLARRLVGEAA